jgi:uncharacterized membrane protein
MYGHRGQFSGWHGGPGVFGLIFLVVLVALAIAAIVALVRMLRAPHVLTAGTATPTGRGEDGALTELRLRYARGEIEREDFLSRLRDLGGHAPETPPPASA